MVKDHSDSEKERGNPWVPSNRQDGTYHGLHGTLIGLDLEIAPWFHHEGWIR